MKNSLARLRGVGALDERESLTPLGNKIMVLVFQFLPCKVNCFKYSFDICDLGKSKNVLGTSLGLLR